MKRHVIAGTVEKCAEGSTRICWHTAAIVQPCTSSEHLSSWLQWTNLVFFIAPNAEVLGPKCFTLKNPKHIGKPLFQISVAILGVTPLVFVS